MSNVIKIGERLIGEQNISEYKGILDCLLKCENGASVVGITSSIGLDVAGISDVKRSLRNLQAFGWVEDKKNQYGASVYMVADSEKVSEFMSVVGEVAPKVAPNKRKGSAKVGKKMSEKVVSKKVGRFFLNGSREVEGFKPGRPSNAQIASECDMNGKLMNPAAFAALEANGGKPDDKLKKAELLELLKKLRSENAELKISVAVLVKMIDDNSEVCDADSDSEVCDADSDSEVCDADSDSDDSDDSEVCDADDDSDDDDSEVCEVAEAC
jgi:hypothetical protein